MCKLITEGQSKSGVLLFAEVSTANLAGERRLVLRCRRECDERMCVMAQSSLVPGFEFGFGPRARQAAAERTRKGAPKACGPSLVQLRSARPANFQSSLARINGPLSARVPTDCLRPRAGRKAAGESGASSSHSHQGSAANHRETACNHTGPRGIAQCPMHRHSLSADHISHSGGQTRSLTFCSLLLKNLSLKSAARRSSPRKTMNRRDLILAGRTLSPAGSLRPLQTAVSSAAAPKVAKINPP